MHHPECADLPAILYYAERPYWQRTLEQIDVSGFRRLYRCRICGQLWRINDWDKHLSQIAVKVPDAESWQTFDASELERELLARTKEGPPCAWEGCGNRALDGMALCAAHLHR